MKIIWTRIYTEIKIAWRDPSKTITIMRPIIKAGSRIIIIMRSIRWDSKISNSRMIVKILIIVAVVSVTIIVTIIRRRGRIATVHRLNSCCDCYYFCIWVKYTQCYHGHGKENGYSKSMKLIRTIDFLYL